MGVPTPPKNIGIGRSPPNILGGGAKNPNTQYSPGGRGLVGGAAAGPLRPWFYGDTRPLARQGLGVGKGDKGGQRGHKGGNGARGRGGEGGNCSSNLPV